MTARLIDGKAEAERLREKIGREVLALRQSRGVTPGLAVVLLGEDPASQVYVRNKSKQTLEAGMNSFEFRLPASTSEAELLALIARLNGRADVHGILVQLPVPKHIAAEKVLRAIDPDKDVDGFHPVNAGLLTIGKPALVPCTPLGCLLLAKTVHESLRGMEVVVVGRSTIVGRPAAQLFLDESCTVHIAHSQTRDLPGLCRQGDILIVAVGKPELVRGDWVRPGATVIDVGINRIANATGGTRLVGDVAFAEASQRAGAITPVPGGVGPMTIACLLSNSLTCAQRSLAQ